MENDNEQDKLHESSFEKTIEKLRKRIEEETIKKFNELKPFKCADDIPDVPLVSKQVYRDVVVPNLIRCGAIPKKDLVVGATYVGDTRNTDSAKWDGEKFVYKRYKWGFSYEDECNHFEDDNGYALFVPIRMIEEGNKNKKE